MIDEMKNIHIPDEKILISRDRYEGLLATEQFLSLLKEYGVGSWDGYPEVVNEFNDPNRERDNI